jgi:quercetin dioxygenase-like cupin family protein
MMKKLFALLIISVVAVAAIRADAQQDSGVTRRPVTKQDLNIPGHEAVLTEVQFAPAARESEHTHPGDVFVYGQEGTVTFHIAGMPDSLLKPGEAVFIPAEKVHWAENAGTKPAKTLAVFIVEKGKPLRSPANR